MKLKSLFYPIFIVWVINWMCLIALFLNQKEYISTLKNDVSSYIKSVPNWDDTYGETDCGIKLEQDVAK